MTEKQPKKHSQFMNGKNCIIEAKQVPSLHITPREINETNLHVLQKSEEHEIDREDEKRLYRMLFRFT
jgi:hypothetical protein